MDTEKPVKVVIIGPGAGIGRALARTLENQKVQAVDLPHEDFDAIPTEESFSDFTTRNKSDRKRNRANRWR